MTEQPNPSEQADDAPQSREADGDDALHMPGDGSDQLPPPPGIGRQAAQLIVIPALITIACIGVLLTFGILAGQPDNIDNHLARLRQSSGAGQMALGMQDPRYKDRANAAANIAQQLPGVEDPAERARIAGELSKILRDNVGPNDQIIAGYLLAALGQLGREGDLRTIVGYADNESALVRRHVVMGVLSWPRPGEAADAALPALVTLTGDGEPTVALLAVSAVGELASPGDQAAVAALRKALGAAGIEQREVQWNAAVALAKLNQVEGARFVADVLLNREALAKMPAEGRDGSAQAGLPPVLQERVLVRTLGSVGQIQNERVWAQVEHLAENDPSSAVQKAARHLLATREPAAQL